MKQYIHYGAEEYNPILVTKDIDFCVLSKPNKGLWGSPVNADLGWKDFCELWNFQEESFAKSFRFRIDKKAKILNVRKEEDILPYVIFDSEDFLRFGLTGICDKLNLKKIYERFDGIELFLSNDYSMHDGIFNSWDCDSIVVWNPKVILPVKKVEE